MGHAPYLPKAFFCFCVEKKWNPEFGGLAKGRTMSCFFKILQRYENLNIDFYNFYLDKKKKNEVRYNVLKFSESPNVSLKSVRYVNGQYYFAIFGKYFNI